MDYIMVTFQYEDKKNADIKIPAFVKVEELTAMLKEALNITAEYEGRLQAEPLGRILNGDMTLEEEGVYHGALLTLI